MKDKAAYKAEGIRRAKLRKAKRKDDRAYKHKMFGRGGCKCEYCGNAMTWCSGCEVWSSTHLPRK
jgi:hypothetical protein